MIKRLFDIVVSLVALVLLSPLLIVLTLTVWLYDFGLPFYFQERVGLRGKHFRIIKLRSMVRNADKLGGYSTAANDSRITPVGHFLRKSSLDELPQLINVIKGDMSLVGPRPDVPMQRSNYTENEWQQRHRVRPGITGLAQVEKRSEATMEERKELDISYASSPGLWWDIVILWKTVLMVVRRRGTN